MVSHHDIGGLDKTVSADIKENGKVRSIKEFFTKIFWLILAEDSEEHGMMKRYPKGKEVEAVYKSETLYEKGEDGLPTKDITGYIYTLSCPICGHALKRSQEFCAECGNKVIV